MQPLSSSSAFRAGFVAVMGRPNVGKSTLMNALLRQKVAAVSPRSQTTRRNQLGILSLPQAQIIFIDTPGVHQPRHKLGEAMNVKAMEALKSCDVALFLIDFSQEPQPADLLLAERLRRAKRKSPCLLALNKADQAGSLQSPEMQARSQSFQALLPGAETLAISALREDGLDVLLEWLIQHLPENPPFYPEEQTTDLYEREIAGDLVREAALRLLREEVPHGIAVRIDEYTERGESGAYIAATIFVEREAHKPIVIGQGGSMLKKIGALARQEIETMSGRKIFLELRVKVRKNWRDDEEALKWLG